MLPNPDHEAVRPTWRRGKQCANQADSAREDDVFFCPRMDLAAVRAAELAALDFCGGPQAFLDRLTARRQFRR